MLRARVLILPVLLAVPGDSASARIVPVSALRVIAIAASRQEERRLATASLEPWQEQLLDTDLVREQGEVIGSVTAESWQISSMSGGVIHAQGSGSGFAFPADGADAAGTSQLTLTFDTEVALPFTLSGRLRVTPQGLELNGSTASLRLVGDAGTVFDLAIDEDRPPPAVGYLDFSESRALSGELAPGRYRLEALAAGLGADGKHRCADFEFVLTVPEPATGMLAWFALASWLRQRAGPRSARATERGRRSAARATGSL
jgi:hypothetical protein